MSERADLQALHDLVERLGVVHRASLREIATRHGLKLVQLEALVYLAQANRYSDTPAALTEYLGITKGTVSQTLIALERHGLVTKATDAHDGRIVHCALTPKARTIVRAAHPAPVWQGLSEAEASASVLVLRQLLRSLQRHRGLKTFGVCHSCRFFEARGAGGRCGLTGERLSTSDVVKLCREHEPSGETDSARA